MKKAQFIYLFFFILFLLLWPSLNEANSQESISICDWSEKIFFLIINNNSMSCPSCVRPIEKFIDFFRANSFGASIFGVIVNLNQESELSPEKHMRIIEKQLDGFKKALRIDFPLILDKYGVFKGFDQDDNLLIYFDIKKRIVKKYKVPIAQDQWNEILSISQAGRCE
jgi:hypothetical protein